MPKEGWNLYYWADRLRAPLSCWDPHRPKAEVLEGQMGGRYIALTIRIRDSSWVCHPYRTGDRWSQDWRGRCHIPDEEPAKRVPRSIRKAAKMALRRFLGTSL